MGLFDNDNAMAGMVGGIKEGLIAYQNNKNQQQQLKLQGLLQGVQQDPQGNFAFTPEKQAQMANEQRVAQYKADHVGDNDSMQAAHQGLLRGEDGSYSKTPEQMALEGIDRKYKQAQIAKLFGDMENEKNDPSKIYKRLPEENKKTIETLAKKNADKVSISNQIDAVMSNWENLPDDQKLQAGRQLIKTLNSTEGADAVGEGEAARLAGKLDYAMGNLFSNNPMQFGRDLPGFKTQAEESSAAIKRAIESNKGVIDEQYGRKGLISQTPKEDPQTAKFAKDNKLSYAKAEAIIKKRQAGKSAMSGGR